MTRERLLASTFAELADALTDEVDVLDFLRQVTLRAAEILGADAVGVILSDPRGRLQLVASSTDTRPVLELFSVATVRGPCRELFETGLPVVNLDAGEAARRWPEFAETLGRAGYGSFHSLPMRVHADVIGALNLAYAGATRLDEDDLAIGEALSGVATVGLLQERTSRQQELLAEKLQAALNVRVMIEQAKGVVAELAGVGVDEASDRMSGYAAAHRLPLGVVARRVLDRSLDLADGAQQP